MPDISLKSSNASTQTGNNTRTADVLESFEQMTLPASVAMNELTPVYVDSNGKFAPSDASIAGTAVFYGLTTRKVGAGETVTAIARGVMGGLDLAAAGLAYGASVYISDTDGGRLSTAAGTVARKVGEVVPVFGQTRGTAPAKVIRVIG
jgi:hypothetical protein